MKKAILYHLVYNDFREKSIVAYGHIIGNDVLFFVDSSEGIEVSSNSEDLFGCEIKGDFYLFLTKNWFSSITPIDNKLSKILLGIECTKK